jgi:hypothetical protein
METAAYRRSRNAGTVISTICVKQEIGALLTFSFFW